ncbi:MAG TPA: coproporphyrinogen-III oxidase family protein, partial [Candidatus Krumholzibacterium sp.]|nr:coproporphyrinogen-III oxidase family protein [Candidatus Krumholzibacterium sp.]
RELGIREGSEVTLEANRDDVDEGRAERWLQAGVNRISLGVQSFDDRALRLLGRRHDAAGSRRALEILLETGFERIGIDLMYGIPGMTAREWVLVLREAASFRPSHISCYMLGIVDSTPMGASLRQGTIEQQGEDELRSLFLTTSRFLGEKGYLHYEVSNYALGAGNVSRHNSGYWDHTPYAGLGPSAHSFDGRSRWWNPADLGRWTGSIESGKDPREGSETLSPGQLAMERLYFGFRTKRGVDLETVRTFDRGEEVLERLVKDGYLLVEGERAVPTLEGYLFSDRLPSMFF